MVFIRAALSDSSLCSYKILILKNCQQGLLQVLISPLIYVQSAHEAKIEQIVNAIFFLLDLCQIYLVAFLRTPKPIYS